MICNMPTRIVFHQGERWCVDIYSDSVNAVSYTHLDVYKRQDLHRSGNSDAAGTDWLILAEPDALPWQGMIVRT